MSRPCLSCGLTYNSLGQLVINGSTWPYATTGCTDAGAGTEVYCAPDGTIHGPAEKFVVDDEVLYQPFAGTREINTLAAIDSASHNIGAGVTFQIANPSNCRDAMLIIDSGIVHGQWEKKGAGNGRSFVQSRVTLAGALVGAGVGAHQLFGHSGSVTDFIVDVMGSYQRHDFNGDGSYSLTLPAGGVVTVHLDGQINNAAYNGSTSYANLIYGVRYRIVSI